MQSSERKRNQRKSPLTPKKSFRKEDSPPAIAMRVGGRVKKAKIPFDPSDPVTKRRQTDSCVPMPNKRFAAKEGPVVQQSCYHCKKCDKPDTLVNCRDDCNAKIHLNCMQSICEHFGKNEEQTWECNNCQSCCICDKGKSLLKCYVCYSYYHPKCHGSEDKIKIVKENRFCCGVCDKGRQLSTPSNDAKETTAPKKTRAFSQTRAKPASTDNKFSNDGFLGFNLSDANEVIESTSDDEASEPNQSFHLRGLRPEVNLTQHRSSISSDHNSCVIDATEWSADQVYEYFRNIFPRHAYVFKDHEIDGPSLYLLKRSDIVRGFDIKIGPALKLYNHILKIQNKSDDDTISWQ